MTQLAFNVGFFMVLPYLSVHLSDDLGRGAAVVGLALGLRTFSQQGLFVVGGALTDRFGTAPLVLTGCALRMVGFLGLAVAQSRPAVLVATAVTGLAAALSSTAVEAALSPEAGERERAGGTSRVSAFALFSLGGQIGAFTGPLLGALLLQVNFSPRCGRRWPSGWPVRGSDSRMEKLSAMRDDPTRWAALPNSTRVVLRTELLARR